MYTVDEVRQLLPKVGDTRMEIRTTSDKNAKFTAEECEVIEVNRAHLWYRVKFKRTGVIECYKVPKTRPLSWEGKK